MKNLLTIFLTVLAAQLSLYGQNCITGCNSNSYLNAVNPNTIEYDNMVGGYHSTMAKKTNQEVYIWGENSKSNGSSAWLEPTEVSPANGYNYTGTILKFTTADYGQHAIITTTGLYIWGRTNLLVDPAVKNTTAFGAVALGTAGVSGTKADGLPAGVSPSDVKMLFGTEKTIAITTCNGQAWVLSSVGEKNGDGSTQSAANNVVWHRVKTGSGSSAFLTNVVAMRGAGNALMALTENGKVYTWGYQTYLANATAPANRTYATEMTLPAGVTVKMIGMTAQQTGSERPYEISRNTNSYYILSTSGRLYSLGSNNKSQLGDFTTTDRTSWIQVHKPTAVAGGSTDSGQFMSDISWFSPQEHDYRHAAVSAISASGVLYSWGSNSLQMIGTSGGSANPTYLPGGLTGADLLLAVETGGHTTISFKQCSIKFGYVGHRINGSMGNGSAASTTEVTYNFDTTPDFNLCGAPTAPTVQNLKSCPGTTVNLAAAHTSVPFVGTTLVWYTTPTRDPGTKVLNPISVGPGTYYAFYEGVCPLPVRSDPVIISAYTSGDASYGSCPDADGDGLDDFTDLDDDNDGILDTVECTPTNEEVIFTQPTAGTNSISASLASGTTVSFTSTYSMFAPLPSGALPDTSHFDNGAYTFLTSNPLKSNRFSFSGIVANTTKATTSITFSNPNRVVKEVYLHLNSADLINLKFLASNNPGITYQILSGNDFVNASTNGTDFLIQDSDSQSGDFSLDYPEIDKTFSEEKENASNGLSADFTVRFSGNNITNLKLEFVGAPAFIVPSTDGGHFALEIKSVADTDGDGIADCLDLDSDNDGCVDAIEGDENVLVTQLTIATGSVAVGSGSPAANQNLGNTIDAQGVPTIVNSGGAADIGSDQGQGVGSSANAAIQAPACNTCDGTIYQDTDGDGVADTCDLDDDNDGILDSVEAPCNGSFNINVAPTAAGTTQTFTNFTATYKTLSGTNATLYNSGGYDGLELQPYGSTETTFSVPVINLKAIAFDMDSQEDITIYAYDKNGALINDISAYAVAGSNVGVTVPAAASLRIKGIAHVTQPDFEPANVVNFNFPIAISKIVYNFTASIDTAGTPGLAFIDACPVIDTDGDGIPNYLDTDSDNDGCPDAIEGAENVTASMLTAAVGTLQGGNGVNPATTPTSGYYNVSVLQNLGIDVDAQGVPKIVNTGGAADTGSATAGTQGQPIGSAANALVSACFIDAVNDINQVPKGVTATGNVLTNDESPSTPITVQSATYLNATGVVTTLPIGTATNVYDAAGTLAGAMTLNANGTYTFVPTATYVGTVPVDYVAVNAVGSTDPAQLTIVVKENPAGGNNTPIAQNDTGYTEMNTPVSSTVLTNDSDPDGNTLTVTGATQGATTIPVGTATVVAGVDAAGNAVTNAGTITLNALGTYTYTPATGFVGTVNPISYTISDGNGGTATAVINLTVLPNVGNNTFGNDDANTGIQGTTLTGNVKTNDTDPEGNPTTVTAATVGGTALTIGTATVLPGVGTLTLNTNGTYTFVPLATYVGTTSVIYTVCDDQSPQACDTATLYLTELPLGVCYNNPKTTGTVLDTKHGITLLQKAGADNGGWPMIRKGAHTALESNSKGFVITRMTSDPAQTATADHFNKITNPQDGMMVYDTFAKCLKIYTVDDGDAANNAWKCYTVPTCP